MSESKSPFFIVQDFASPLMCEQIIDMIDFYSPELDKSGKPVKAIRRNENAENLMFNKFQTLVPQIEEYYDVSYKGTEPIYVEWFPEESEGSFICESSSYLRKKWVKTKDRDFTAMLFLSDYQDNTPFDNEFEVYGGKLEFPQWGFGFNPQRGTLIVYPSDPHFINITTRIFVGDLFQARIHIATNTPYLFDAKKFPGDYKTWFKDIG